MVVSWWIFASGANAQPANKLYSRCAAVGLTVESVGQDAKQLGLSNERIRNAAESRLRAARLFDSASSQYLYVNINVSKERTFNVSVDLDRWIEDTGYGIGGSVSVWHVGAVGAGGSTHIIGVLSERLDQFVAEYLGANDAVCVMKEQRDYEGLLRIEGVTLSQMRLRFGDRVQEFDDGQLEASAWQAYGDVFEDYMSRDEFRRQFMELPRP